MIYTIENSTLSVSVDTSGAQLQSVYSKQSKTEYLWQGDSAFWSGRAYNLFPVVGRMYKNVYSYQGDLFRIGLHGFARHSLFILEERSATRLVLLLTENQDTLQEYPFRFEFRVIYELNDNVLTVQYSVTNTDDKTLICAFGGHPGINIPFGDGCFEDYYLEFSDRTCVQRQLLSDGKPFMADKSVPYALENGTKLPLFHHLFDHDAIILSNTSRRVSIKSNKDHRYVTMDYSDFKYIGVWHPGKLNAPFVCLEPWSALPATDGIVDNLEEKANMAHVPKGKKHSVSYTLEINE